MYGILKIVEDWPSTGKKSREEGEKEIISVGVVFVAKMQVLKVNSNFWH